MMFPPRLSGWGVALPSAILLGCGLYGFRLARTSSLDVPPRAPLPPVVRFTDGKTAIGIQPEKIGLDPKQRSLDLVKAAKTLKQLSKKVDDPGKSARIRRTRDGFQITPSRDTRKMDVDKALRSLITYTNSAYPETPIPLKVAEKRPRITTEEMKRVKGRIASFSTRYNPGDRSRSQNVRLVAQHLNGAVIPIGGTFSFNDHVGPRTPRRGYQTAFIFVRGRMVKDTGGGTCQVSSTLYNAALLAGLKIVERHNHSFTVPYVSPGRDATVYYGSSDFRFRNTTDAPIYIQASAGGGYMSVSLYGGSKPEHRIQIVNWSRRKGNRVYAGASRIYRKGEKVVRRETLSSDVYTPLELAQQG